MRRPGLFANRASLRGATSALWIAAVLTLAALIGLGTSLHSSQTSSGSWTTWRRRSSPAACRRRACAWRSPRAR